MDWCVLFFIHATTPIAQDLLLSYTKLALRDYLRAFPEAAKHYEAVKMQVVRSGVSSLLKYSEAKSAVIEELLLRALEWRRIP
jgi:GrpB-like predicted nucleotidyltransferase (UPF0157 family)